MASDPNIVDRIKPFIRKLEGSIEHARRQRLEREGGPRGSAPANSTPSPAPTPSPTPPSSHHESTNGNGLPNRPSSADQPIGSATRKAIPRGMQARPLVRRSSF